MANFNYKISSKEGKFYQSSKTPKEGYVEVPYDGGLKKTYHQYERTLTGVPVNFKQNQFTYEGITYNTIELVLKNGDDYINISTMLWTPKGQYTNEAKGLISAMLGYTQVNEPITITANLSKWTDKANKERTQIGFYVNYVNIKNEQDKGLSTGFIKYTDLPSPDVKEVAGKKIYDWSTQTEFYYQKLNEISNRFGSNSSKQSNESVPQSYNTHTSFEEDGDDDLPF